MNFGVKQFVSPKGTFNYGVCLRIDPDDFSRLQLVYPPEYGVGRLSETEREEGGAGPQIDRAILVF